MNSLKKSLVVEAALAGLFAAAFVMPAAAQGEAPKGGSMPAAVKKASAKKTAERVHCFGANACKGTSECAVDGKTQCKGQNACKGQGWISLAKKTCAKRKGTVVK